MHIYNYLISSKENIADELRSKNICFLDIETTGFSREKNNIYLIGLFYYSTKNDNWYIKQFFAEDFYEEKSLLREVVEFISKFDYLVTFNGERFDIPFIKHRLNMYDIENAIDNIKSFDLYKEIKTYSSLLNLKNYKLKTIEESIGIYRHDKYSGKDCIKFYYEYMNTKDNDLLDKILKHNYDDLYYLIDIFKVFNIIEDIKNVNIIINGQEKALRIEEVYTVKDMFNIICKAPIDHNIAYFEDGFSIRWEKTSIQIDLECKKGLITPTKECVFIDISLWPSDINFEDKSEYFTPKDIILLKVENEFQIENIKNTISQIVVFIQ